MRELHVFDSISVDGYFKSSTGDMQWTHDLPGDPEFDTYVRGNASGGGTLLFGRVTYEMMLAFWPTPAAAKQFPDVAKGMNAAEKIVASRTLETSTWNNTTILEGDLASSIRELKSREGKGITILGSGSLVAQLAKANLVDRYTFVVQPIALGAGKALFESKIDLELTSSRIFPSGKVVLTYVPR